MLAAVPVDDDDGDRRLSPPTAVARLPTSARGPGPDAAECGARSGSCWRSGRVRPAAPGPRRGTRRARAAARARLPRRRGARRPRGPAAARARASSRRRPSRRRSGSPRRASRCGARRARSVRPRRARARRPRRSRVERLEGGDEAIAGAQEGRRRRRRAASAASAHRRRASSAPISGSVDSSRAWRSSR